jgi:hypothetical protein
VDPHDEDVLVVAAVEDPDVTGDGQGLSDAPEERVLLLLVRGGLEGRDLDALRVDRPHDVAHDAALARGVHALDDEQHRPRPVALGLGVEALLEVAESGLQVLHERRAGLLAAVEPRGRRGVDVGEAEALVHAQDLRPHHRLQRVVAPGLLGLLALLGGLLRRLAAQLGIRGHLARPGCTAVRHLGARHPLRRRARPAVLLRLLSLAHRRILAERAALRGRDA